MTDVQRLARLVDVRRKQRDRIAVDMNLALAAVERARDELARAQREYDMAYAEFTTCVQRAGVDPAGLHLAQRLVAGAAQAIADRRIAVQQAQRQADAVRRRLQEAHTAVRQTEILHEQLVRRAQRARSRKEQALGDDLAARKGVAS